MEYVRLKDIGRIITGNTPPTSKIEYYGDYMPFIKATDIPLDRKCTLVTEQSYSELAAKKYKESLVPKGSTCVVTIGSIGKKMTYAHTDLFVNQAINAIIPKDSYDKEYVYYDIKYSVLPQLKKLDSGTTSGRENISKSSFSSIRIPVIKDKNVQHRIASILSTYDTLIENNTKRIRLLEKMAENLYKEWFVRFHFPEHEKMEMENGLPKGWKWGKLGDIVNFLNGFAFKSQSFCAEGKFSIVTIKNVQADGFDGNNTDKILEIPSRMPKHCLLKEGDVLLSLTGNIGRVCRVLGSGYLLNQRVAKLKSERPLFCYCTFKSDYIYQSLNVISYGTAQLNLSPVKALKIKLQIPTTELMDRFEQQVEPVFAEIDNLQQQNTLLARQRDLLLPRLMSGKLEV